MEMVFPPALIGAMFVKKLTSYAVYQTASNYGWPRVYKRILELNKVHTPLHHQDAVRYAVRGAIESPLQIYNVITDSKVVDFAKNVVQSKIFMIFIISCFTKYILSRILCLK